MAAVLPKGRSSTANSGTQVASLCGIFPLLSALQIVGVLKITPHSYPWLEVDIGKIMCPLHRFSKYGNPILVTSMCPTGIVAINSSPVHHVLVFFVHHIPGLNSKPFRSMYVEKAYSTVISDSSVGWGH